MDCLIVLQQEDWAEVFFFLLLTAHCSATWKENIALDRVAENGADSAIINPLSLDCLLLIKKRSKPLGRLLHARQFLGRRKASDCSRIEGQTKNKNEETQPNADYARERTAYR